MPSRSELTPAIRERICELHSAAKWGYKRIHQRYPTVSLSTIRYTIKKEHERRDGVSKPRSGRPKKPKDANKAKDADKVQDADQVQDADKGKHADKVKDTNQVQDADKVKDADKVQDCDKVHDANKVRLLDAISENTRVTHEYLAEVLSRHRNEQRYMEYLHMRSHDNRNYVTLSYSRERQLKLIFVEPRFVSWFSLDSGRLSMVSCMS
jgi:hypothetical protein